MSKVWEDRSGFEIETLVGSTNPIYMIKYADAAMPIVGFLKAYDHPFNPSTNFAAVMTCSQADGGCPFIVGAEKRISITFEVPKYQMVHQHRQRSITNEVDRLHLKCSTFSQ